MKWEASRILVTGGAGFIGSNLVKRVLDLGSEVYVEDNFSREREENIRNFLDRIRLYRVDLTKLDHCLLATEGVDYIFHLAASVGRIRFMHACMDGSTPSLLMNTYMLEAARKKDVK